MSFNFFGTFTSKQFQDLVDFARIQKTDLEGRKEWLSSELLKVGAFETIYDEDDKYPVSFTCAPDFSYGAKLLKAYKILGGIPERDMLLRTSDKPVFLKKGVNANPSDPDSGYSREFSNGRLYRGNQRFDRDLGLRVEAFKKWQLEAIKRKREHLEFKIKRALDYSDQLQNEINLIDTVLGSDKGSFEDMLSEINKTILTPGSMNVVDDPDDGFGLGIGQISDPYVDLPSEVAAKKYRGLP